MRRLTVVAAFIALSSAALLLGDSAPLAFAEGPSIAAATVIALGQQEFGNTLDGHQYKNDNCLTGTRTDFESFWVLNAVVGDKFVVTWEAVPQTWIEVLPVGTTDFNYTKAKSFVHESISSNGKGEFTFSETSTGGILPFVVHNALCEPPYGPGPYNFTVGVTHALEVSLPITHVLHRNGTLSVSTHNPEGLPIKDPAVQVDVQIKERGGWRTIGHGTAANALIAYKLPATLRHVRHATLRALANGTGYAPASSAHQKLHTL